MKYGDEDYCLLISEKWKYDCENKYWLYEVKITYSDENYLLLIISEKWKYNCENNCWLYEERMKYCYEDYLLFILNRKWIYNYEIIIVDDIVIL